MLIGALRSRFFHASVSLSSDSNGPEMMSDGGRCKLPKYLNTHVRSTGVIWGDYDIVYLIKIEDVGRTDM